MNPLHLVAQAYRTFERLDIAFPTGCVAITGPNGSGKSSILNAIDVCLFAGRGELPALLTTGEEELLLELTFEHGNELYRVRRMYSAKGRGKTTLDFEHSVPGYDESDLRAGLALARQGVDVGRAYHDVWEPLTRETAEQTQELIGRTLGLSRTTFRASSFLAQGDGAAFTDAPARDRKAILAEILGLDVYDRLLDAARVELRQVQDETLMARGRISALQEQASDVERLAETLAVCRRDLKLAGDRRGAAAAELERAQRAEADNAAAVERARAADAQVAGAREAQERARQAYAAAVQAGVDREQRQADLDALASSADAVPDLERQLDEIREATTAIAHREALQARVEQHRVNDQRLTGQLAALREHAAELVEKAEHLDAHIDQSELCDRCGQTLGAEAAVRAAASFRAEAREAIGKLDDFVKASDVETVAIVELTAELNAIYVPAAPPIPIHVITEQLAIARAAGERRAVLVEQVRQLAELSMRQDDLTVEFAHTVDRASELERLAEVARGYVGNVNVLSAAVDGARQTVDHEAAAVQRAQEAVTRVDVALQQAKDAAAEHAQLLADLEVAQKRIDILKLAERAFGRDGIPALILEASAIPWLEMEANRILGELGTGYRVELRTQRAKKDGSLADTLEIVVFDEADARPYETFSGGEKTRINLALRLALAGLLATRRGAQSRLLAIDELDGLDSAGMDRLVAVLNGLGASFDRILLVSHQAQLASSFDQTIQVEKIDGRSSIVAAREPVMA